MTQQPFQLSATVPAPPIILNQSRELKDRELYNFLGILTRYLARVTKALERDKNRGFNGTIDVSVTPNLIVEDGKIINATT